MWFGDSITGLGGTGAAVSARDQFWTDSRSRGLDVRAFARTYQGTVGEPHPYEPWSDGNSGYMIEDLTALMGGAPTITAPSPLTKNFIGLNGQPDLIVLGAGTNNIDTSGDSAATCETKLTTLLAQITATCPNARVIVTTIPSFYSPATPSGGIAAANASVAAYNAWILANVPGLSPLYSVVDPTPQWSNDTAYPPDGTHLTEEGAAARGRSVTDEAARLFSGRRGPVSPRPFKPRSQQASVRLPTAGTSKIQTNAPDAGWILPAASFAVGARIQILGLSAGVDNYVFSSCPVGGNGPANGFSVTIDASVSPPKWTIYLKGIAGAAASFAAPVVADLPIWLSWHVDDVARTITLWIAMPHSLSVAGSVYVCACVGGATGIAAFSQGDPNPLFNIGTDSTGVRGGPAMIVDNVWMASGKNLPGVFSFRPAFEAWVYDGTDIPGVTASLHCAEGTGAVVASGSGGQSATIATGDWSASGEVSWPSDENGDATPTAWTTVDMNDANQVLPSSSFNATTIELTGPMTGDHTITLPRRKGRIVTLNNKTIGGHNTPGIGLTGVSAGGSPGISRVYWDGVNFVPA